MQIAEWACLREGRENFTVRPEVDSQFYFGRTSLRDNIAKQLRYGVAVLGVPKMVIWGAYGAGKTHTLYHIKWHLETVEPTPCQVRVVKTPLLTKGSTFASLHAKLIDSLGLEFIRDTVNQHMATNAGSWVEALESMVGDSNIAHALRGLTLFGTMQLTAWRWLMGERISDVDQANLNITRSYHSSEDLVAILKALGAVLRDVRGERLVFLIDEAELMDGVRNQEAVDSFTEAMRLLASDDNGVVGFVVGLVRGAEEEDSSMRILVGGSVKGRLGEANYIEIPPLEPVVANQFVKDLLAELIDPDCVSSRSPAEPDLFPFSAEALELLDQWIVEDPLRQLPRHIIQGLNNGAFAAWEAEDAIVTGEAMARALDV